MVHEVTRVQVHVWQVASGEQFDTHARVAASVSPLLRHASAVVKALVVPLQRRVHAHDQVYPCSSRHAQPLASATAPTSAIEASQPTQRVIMFTLQRKERAFTERRALHHM